MRHRSRLDVALLAGLLLAAPGARGEDPAEVPKEGVPVARLTFVERLVEQAADAGKWRKAKEGVPFRTGERLRTAPDAVARIDFPWMSVTLGPASVVTIPNTYVLSTVLEQGRVQLNADGRDILKLRTADAEVRGRGRVVVRREREATLVMSVAGRFVVEGAGKTVALAEGKGTIVPAGREPLPPVDLAAPPEGLWPGLDPVFVGAGNPVALTWKPGGTSHYVELLPVGSDVVLIQRDVGRPPWRLEIPWTGAFRWRVSARDARGLEGRPSADGMICVVEKRRASRPSD